MNKKRYVLDTSALITMLEKEPGFERVKQVLVQEECFLPWTSVLEISYISRRERGDAESEYRYALIRQFPVTILWNVDEPTLLTAARFKASFRISLADAIIAAYACQLEAVLLHKDPEFELLSKKVQLEALPYKTNE